MRKLSLLTLALVATVMLFASPIVAEASEPLGSPTVEFVDTEIGTSLGHIVKSEVIWYGIAVEQVSMEVTSEWPTWSPDTRIVYAEETPSYRITYYGKSFSPGSDKVPL